MHWQALQFCELVKNKLPEIFINARVVEVGSHYVNKSIRVLFEKCDYIGVDLSAGKGVDIVSSGHEFDLDKAVDLAISCECFEHNPVYLETFENMARLTRGGGVVLFSCATTGRPEHGTSRTSPESSPGTAELGWDYYKNLVESDFPIDLLNRYFSYYKFYTNPLSQDLYFIGLRKGQSNIKRDAFDAIDQKVEALISASKKVENITSLIAKDERIKSINLCNDILVELGYPRNPMLLHILWQYYQYASKEQLDHLYTAWCKLLGNVVLEPFDYALGARIEVMYGHFEEALKLLDNAIDNLEFSAPGIIALRMKVNAELNNHDAAFKDCFLVFASCGENIDLHIQCAKFLREVGSNEIALNILKCALLKAKKEEVKKKLKLLIASLK